MKYYFNSLKRGLQGPMVTPYAKDHAKVLWSASSMVSCICSNGSIQKTTEAKVLRSTMPKSDPIPHIQCLRTLLKCIVSP